MRRGNVWLGMMFNLGKPRPQGAYCLTLLRALAVLVLLLCANALADNKIDHADIWPGCDVVPAGLVEIVRLQREGFAYIKP